MSTECYSGDFVKSVMVNNKEYSIYRFYVEDSVDGSYFLYDIYQKGNSHSINEDYSFESIPTEKDILELINYYNRSN